MATRKPKREPPEGTKSLFVYLPVDLVDGIDAWVDRLNEASDGPRWTRTDVVRRSLARSLEERGKKGEAP
jgi:hypothetical protein